MEMLHGIDAFAFTSAMTVCNFTTVACNMGAEECGVTVDVEKMISALEKCVYEGVCRGARI